MIMTMRLFIWPLLTMLVWPSNAQTIRATDLTPQCPAHFKWENSQCQDDGSISSLTVCEGIGIEEVTGKCKAKTPPPSRQCPELIGYVGSTDGNLCSYSRPPIASSARGDYIGDCIVANSAPSPSVPAGKYIVTNQEKPESGGIKLTLVEAYGQGWFYCGAAKNGRQLQTSDTQLMNAGALRRGWTYGILTMPYKYYRSSKTFTSSAPIGGYLGRRYGQTGSGFTWAIASTISSVKVDTIDPNNLVSGQATTTGSTNVMAFSYAIGIMFDLSKSSNGRPFKSGLFLGVDRVNSDPSIRFRENGKPWLAIQFGYDFTDN